MLFFFLCIPLLINQNTITMKLTFLLLAFISASEIMVILIPLAVIIILIFLLRPVNLWYWKIDKRLKALEEIRDLLQRQENWKSNIDKGLKD